jgi:large subunit ribosomal protein L15
MSPAKKKAAEVPAKETRIAYTDVIPAKGSRIKKLRVGRGRATGAGKTCNRGHNGEGQRSGRSSKRGFEGGQMPGYRQMPKIDGFMVVNRRNWFEFNIGDLDGMFEADVTTITEPLLVEYGYIKLKHDGARLLGNGATNKAFTIEVSHVTPGAKAKIEAAGGKVVEAVGQAAG